MHDCAAPYEKGSSFSPIPFMTLLSFLVPLKSFHIHTLHVPPLRLSRIPSSPFRKRGSPLMFLSSFSQFLLVLRASFLPRTLSLSSLLPLSPFHGSPSFPLIFTLEGFFIRFLSSEFELQETMDQNKEGVRFRMEGFMDDVLPLLFIRASFAFVIPPPGPSFSSRSSSTFPLLSHSIPISFLFLIL